ncbi:MAG: hypothetical protein KGI49_03535 [Patescibacteria group bacterium]|nr:hypothetical protein [Patescibacteria group bacterium]
MYEHVLKPVLFRFDPEDVHDFFTRAGEFMGGHGPTEAIVEAMYGYSGPDISKTVDGIRYRTPFLLSAGFDYNGRLSRILPHIGLGGEEVGSVTARPCAGNQKPRLKRLPLSRSIMVNKGLRNDGVDKIIERLKEIRHDTKVLRTKLSEPSEARAVAKATEKQVRRQQAATPVREGELSCHAFVIGISIARTNDEQSVPIEAGIADYCYSFRRLNEEGIGHYYTLNISCPNAFGAEAFNSDPTLLDKLLTEIKKIPCSKPVYVKMPINAAWEHFKELLEVIDKHGLNGVVIGNLNKDYSSLDVRSEAPAEYHGGLSGKPCEQSSTVLIRKTREHYGNRFTIIGAGGVASPASALAKFAAGADLVQLITGLIYEGPGLVKEMCRAVAAGH